jgi:hypothetical protein
MIFYTSKLWSRQSIKTPCYWICPIKPSPPYWNFLLPQVNENERIKVNSWTTYTNG